MQMRFLKKNKMQIENQKKKAVTIIELLFCVFILSILIFPIITAANTNLTNNQIISTRAIAYLIADNCLKEKNNGVKKIVYNSIEYTISTEITNTTADKIISLSVDIPISEYTVKLTTVTVQWTINKTDYKISLKAVED